MLDDNKVNLFLSLMAYSNGAWNVDDVIKGYEYLTNIAKAVPEGKLRLFKATDAPPGKINH